MKSIYSFLTAVVLLMSTNAIAQRTMFGSNNNYIAPPFVFVDVATGTNPVTTDLKMYLDATRIASYSGTGTTWSDISGVTPANNVTLSTKLIFGQSSVANGSGSFTFDGTTGAYATPTGAISLTTATFIAWVNPAVGCPDYAGIIMNRGKGGNNSVSGLLLGGKPSGGSQEHYVLYNWNQYDQMTQTLVVPNNKWSMIAVSISSTQAKVYLFNAAGSTSQSHNYSHAGSSGNKFYIGTDPISEGRNYKGKIGTAMIYNTVLTSQNLTDIYNAQKAAFGI